MAAAVQIRTSAGRFTCVSCNLIFSNHEEQVEHYKTDFHRFNLKRKVAELPPVTLEVYQQKLESQQQKAEQQQSGIVGECTTCGKKFRSNGALQQHLNSRKHREAEEAKKSREGGMNGVHVKSAVPVHIMDSIHGNKQTTKKPVSGISTSIRPTSTPVQPTTTTTTNNTTENTTVDKETTEQPEEPEREKTEDELLEEHIKNAKRLELEDCLFCNLKSPSFAKNMEHMTRVHSFFIPDFDYLTDLEGFIKYLGEKISIGLTCLYCNGKGRSFYSLEAVQAHMRDLSHCKILYEGNEEEYLDFYDYEALERDRGLVDDDDEKISVFVDDETKELVLVGNKALGHRENRIYFKQRRSGRDNALILSLGREYKIMQAKEAQKATLPPENYVRERNLREMKIGVQANKLQRYFRHQNPK